MTRYLDVATVVAINARQDGGVGVRDQAGVESTVNRPASGFGGVDTFKSLWQKAAAYLHGLASTQSFFDGNKRTAWLTAVMFLDANGITLRHLTDIEAEALTYAVALDAWKSDHNPMATIDKAAEWLQRHAEATAIDDPSSWDLDTSMSSMVITGAFFADVARTADGKLDVLGGVWEHATVESLPTEIGVNLVMICQTGSDDVGEVRTINAELIRPGAEPVPWFVLAATIDTAENRFFHVKALLHVREPGRHVVRLTVGNNGLTARSVALDVRI